jgi:hypothetical protein
MNTFEYTVTLKVSVEAFDESDAWDAVQDAFGAGDQMGVNVLQCEFEENRKKGKS